MWDGTSLAILAIKLIFSWLFMPFCFIMFLTFLLCCFLLSFFIYNMSFSLFGIKGSLKRAVWYVLGSSEVSLLCCFALYLVASLTNTGFSPGPHCINCIAYPPCAPYTCECSSNTVAKMLETSWWSSLIVNAFQSLMLLFFHFIHWWYYSWRVSPMSCSLWMQLSSMHRGHPEV